MYTLKYLITESVHDQTELNGQWVPARPIRCCFKDRFKDALKVLFGKADAFTWPEDDR